jgi:hypothetical protein
LLIALEEFVFADELDPVEPALGDSAFVGGARAAEEGV